MEMMMNRADIQRYAEEMRHQMATLPFTGAEYAIALGAIRGIVSPVTSSRSADDRVEQIRAVLAAMDLAQAEVFTASPVDTRTCAHPGDWSREHDHMMCDDACAVPADEPDLEAKYAAVMDAAGIRVERAEGPKRTGHGPRCQCEICCYIMTHHQDSEFVRDAIARQVGL